MTKQVDHASTLTLTSFTKLFFLFIHFYIFIRGYIIKITLEDFFLCLELTRPPLISRTAAVIASPFALTRAAPALVLGIPISVSCNNAACADMSGKMAAV